MTTTIDQLSERMTAALDEAEERLPVVPARILRLERTIAGRTTDAVVSVANAARASIERVNTQAATSAKTVVGTARRSVTSTLDTARTGYRTVVGQGSAQISRVGDAAEREMARANQRIAETAADAIEVIDPDDDASTGYDRWTREELYEKAVELDISGRSSMDKAELLAAVRSHQG
ncbi:MAG: hypothetical protein DHS20C19_05030 [Acidimicrobiales bacterium]|nr:MAG: hypothetical protein DHS20C19_05030 [Acidimicrobiales bacterium]